MPVINEETILLKHIWRKAYKEDVVINLETSKEAQRIRFALYNAVKPVKDGKIVDPELLLAATNVSITFDNKNTLRLARTLTGTLAALAKAVDFDLKGAIDAGEGQEATEEESEAAESLRKLMAKLEQKPDPQDDIIQTPYYNRPKAGD